MVAQNSARIAQFARIKLQELHITNCSASIIQFAKIKLQRLHIAP